MDRTATVHQAIEAHYHDLTDQMRRIADYVLANRSTAFSLSVNELADAATVSQATVVRFARAVGFAGYQQLRGALTEEAKTELSPAARFAATATPSNSTLERVAGQEIENIQRTLESCTPAALARAHAALRAARHVATVGAGVSSLLAQLASYQLQLVGISASAVTDGPLSLPEQIELLPAKSCALCIGFPPYSRATLRAAKQARGRGLSIVAITDGARSPLAPLATATLVVRAENLLFTNSLSAAVVVINTLVTDLALRSKPRALARLAALDEAGAAEHGT